MSPEPKIYDSPYLIRNKTLLIYYGLWPYRSKLSNRFKFSIFITTTISLMIPMVSVIFISKNFFLSFKNVCVFLILQNSFKDWAMIRARTLWSFLKLSSQRWWFLAVLHRVSFFMLERTRFFLSLLMIWTHPIIKNVCSNEKRIMLLLTQLRNLCNDIDANWQKYTDFKERQIFINFARRGRTLATLFRGIWILVSKLNYFL